MMDETEQARVGGARIRDGHLGRQGHRLSAAFLQGHHQIPQQNKTSADSVDRGLLPIIPRAYGDPWCAAWLGQAGRESLGRIR